MSIIDTARERLAHIMSDRGPKLFRDFVSLVSGQSVSMVIGFLVFAYLARVLDATQYGAVELAISIAAFSAIVIECGAGTIGVRELARTPDRAPDLAAQVPAARLMLALIVVPAVGIAGYFTNHDPELTLLIWIYALSLLAVPFKQEWLLQGYEKMAVAALAQPIRTAIFAGGVFLFVVPGSSILTVGWIELTAVAAVSVYYLIAQYVWTVPYRFGWPPRAALYFLKEGFSVGLANMLWAFMLYAPMFLLVSLATGVGPAWLGAAQRIVISLMTLSFVYHFNLYPVITRTVQHDRKTWGLVMRSSVHLVAWAGIALALLLTLLSKPIMGSVFGPDFRAAGPVLSVLAWAVPIRMLSGHARWSLIGCNRQKYLLWAEIAGAVVLVCTGVATIPVLGAPGAALALCSGLLASGIVTQIAAGRLIGSMALVKSVATPLAAASAGLVLSNWVTTNPKLQFLICSSIYFSVGLTQIAPLYHDLQRIAYAKEIPG